MHWRVNRRRRGSHVLKDHSGCREETGGEGMRTRSCSSTDEICQWFRLRMRAAKLERKGRLCRHFKGESDKCVNGLDVWDKRKMQNQS